MPLIQFLLERDTNALLYILIIYSRADRSMFVSEMLPPPDVTTVLETQKSTPKAAPGRKQSAQEVSVLQIQQPNILKI